MGYGNGAGTGEAVSNIHLSANAGTAQEAEYDGHLRRKPADSGSWWIIFVMRRLYLKQTQFVGMASRFGQDTRCAGRLRIASKSPTPVRNSLRNSDCICEVRSRVCGCRAAKRTSQQPSGLIVVHFCRVTCPVIYRYPITSSSVSASLVRAQYFSNHGCGARCVGCQSASECTCFDRNDRRQRC